MNSPQTPLPRSSTIPSLIVYEMIPAFHLFWGVVDHLSTTFGLEYREREGTADLWNIITIRWSPYRIDDYVTPRCVRINDSLLYPSQKCQANLADTVGT